MRWFNHDGSAENLNKCFEILAGANFEPGINGSATWFKYFKFGLWLCSKDKKLRVWLAIFSYISSSHLK